MRRKPDEFRLPDAAIYLFVVVLFAYNFPDSNQNLSCISMAATVLLQFVFYRQNLIATSTTSFLMRDYQKEQQNGISSTDHDAAPVFQGAACAQAV